MKTYNIYEAKTNLSKIIELVQAGEDVVIAKNGKPVVDLRKHTADTNKQKRKAAFGSMTSTLQYKDEDFEGVDPEIQEMFYGKDWDKQ